MQTPLLEAEQDLKDLQDLGIIQLLTADPRPTFIVNVLRSAGKLAPLYLNTALENAFNLKAVLFAMPGISLSWPVDRISTFAQWVDDASSTAVRTQFGHDWTIAIIAGRWKVVCGKLSEAKSTGTLRKSVRTSVWCTPEDLEHLNLENPVRHDWIDYTQPSSIRDASAHLQLFWATSWAATDLGPMSNWSSELRHEVNNLMNDPRATSMYWGPERVLLYNEAFIPMLGKMHPCMGNTVEQTWGESYTIVKPLFDEALTTGRSVKIENSLTFTDRNGYVEETYFTWWLIPIIGQKGYPGCSGPTVETTQQYIASRQKATLRLLGQYVSVSRTLEDYWKQTMRALESNSFDIPFAAVYSLSSGDGVSLSSGLSEGSDTASEDSSIFGFEQWILEATLGLEESDLPKYIEADQPQDAFVPDFATHLQADTHSILSVANGTFPKCLIDKARSRAFGDVCDALMLLPMRSTSREKILGFFLIGINPRRELDSHYQQFIQLFYGQLVTSMASVLFIDEEVRRNKIAAKLAAADRMRLADQLAAASAHVAESESRFRRMADIAPISLFHLDKDGALLYANDLWYQLTGQSREGFAPLDWLAMVHEDDLEGAVHHWSQITQGNHSSMYEFRLRKPYDPNKSINGVLVKGETWVLADGYSTKDDDGNITGHIGCLVDISQHKWVEALQENAKNEALEMKRIQENFIDMTSHEMRNPLSAIILCGDTIVTALEFLTANCPDEHLEISRQTVNSLTEAANVVALCAQHQKRIIDDVLTLSKLDAGLLLVTPVEVQPASTIEQALRMFEGEASKADIQLKYILDPSYHKLEIDWVYLDPARMLQVLINIITNSIKFTSTSATRRITVTVKASVERPSSDPDGVQYIPAKETLADPLAEKPSEPTVFIIVEIKDTGRGMMPHEKTLLFQRFSQVSAKTHIEYGGSGLGLFISRQLTEMQGGEIGVASEFGVGSTFAFYLKSVCCASPIPAGIATVRNSITSVPRRHSADIPNGSAVQTIRHLLIVEDNLVNQRVTAKQLQQAGFEVSVANHGLEALEHVRGTRFWAANAGNASVAPLDVILCDIEMPVMDGLTFAGEVRKLQESGEIVGHVPIIAVTANARAEQQLEMRTAGMDTVITKPWRMPELMYLLGTLRI